MSYYIHMDNIKKLEEKRLILIQQHEDKYELITYRKKW